ncbi:winged helix-turn-helix transcriptional regulator [Gorillibacterium timonense]|uniref:winged helix-turn-helix transcriptional regulator n=1 Tax=Gorillibacterium timonense TaxID=1689269 RepID=UPI00071DABB9|nr:helix-turn-helix domain-containing protein [Gorillibacterium timonense]
MADTLCYVGNKEPFEYTLAVISGKWKLKIIYLLACMGTVRYGVIKRNIDGITHKMLSSQLKELENESIIERREYPQVPPKVEYSLTPKGKSLLPLVQEMCAWGEKQSRVELME